MYSLDDVASEVKATYPQLNGRVERAASLVQAGMVQPAGHNAWYVCSHGDGEQTYLVRFDRQWICECRDWTGQGHHKAPVLEAFGSVGPICKHCLAVVFAWLADGQGESE